MPSPTPRPPPAPTSSPCWRPATPWSTTCTTTPVLSGQHGIRYDTADLAGELGLLLDGGLAPSLADDSVLRTAEDAYVTAAGEAFWAEAENIARDRAALHPGTSSQRGEA